MIRTLLFFLCLYMPFNVLSQTSGGPDAYGYIWRTEAHPQGPDVKWVDITTRQGAYDITNRFDDDSNFGPINFSFEFPYYWYTRSFLYIGSNGYISFQDNQIAATFPTIPQEGGKSDDYIAGYMTDLTLAGDGNPGQVWFYTDFKDTAIVSWINVPFFAPGTNYQGANTFQIILSRPDSSITFQYTLQSGTAVSGGLTIGIENVNGKAGLRPNAAITGTTPATAKAIKFYHPGSSAYKIKDAAVLWNNIPGNGGKFVSMNGPSPKMTTNVVNQGTTVCPPSNVIGRIFNSAGTQLAQGNKISDTLSVGEDINMAIPVTFNTNTAGTYRYEGSITWTGDEATFNNSLSQLLVVVDTSQAEVNLNYTTGSNGSISWLGAVGGNSGLGTYIEPPFYPVEITHVLTYLTGTGGPPTDGVMVRILDDNGKNLFGQYDGSPGDTLAEQIFVALPAGNNALALTTPIQINSKGVYIAVLQMSQNVRIGTEFNAPHSYRSYEVLNGVFSSFRDRKISDPNIGMRVRKGNLAIVIDAGISKLVQPVQGQQITDSVQVIATIRNYGPNPVSGPFDVVYKIDNRAEVRETFNGTVAAGDSVNFTFSQKAARPPAPRTEFDSLCVRTDMNNDFNLGNNTQCIYGTSMGISSLKVNKPRLYPQPATGMLYVRGERHGMPVSFELFDLRGICVHTGKYDQDEFSIDLSAIPAGVYFYRWLNTSVLHTGKLSVGK